MTAVQITEAGGEAGPPTGTENTDPSLNVAAIEKAIAARDAKLGNEDQTEPALDASLVKAALARARALHGGVIGEPRTGGSIGDRGVGGDDPTLPPMPAVNVRAATEPPPMGEPKDAKDASDVELDTALEKPRPKELDGVATEDTGPLPRVEGDKVG
jgi:hypothetical protein